MKGQYPLVIEYKHFTPIYPLILSWLHYSAGLQVSKTTGINKQHVLPLDDNS